MARVLLCLPRFHTNAAPWVRLLQGAGHRVCVHVQRIGPVEDHALAVPQLIPPAGWALAFDQLLRAMRGGRADPQFRHAPPLRAYWHRMRAEAPDVVLVRGITRWFSLTAALMALIQGRRVVVYDQDAPAPAFLRGTWWRRALCCILGMERVTARACLACDQGDFAQGGFAQARTLPFAAARCSDALMAQARRRIAQDAGIGRILMVGKYRERKGHAALIDALAELAARRHFTLTICAEEVSSADRAFRADLENRVRFCGIGGRVRFVANVARADMAQLYAGHALFVLPSLAEPAAVSPIEAVWHGALALMDRHAGTRQYLPPEDDFCFDASAPLDIARTLDPLLASPDLLRERRGRCLDHLAALGSDAAVRAVLERHVLGRSAPGAALDLAPHSSNCSTP